MKPKVTPDQIERYLQENLEVESSVAFEQRSKRFAMATYFTQYGKTHTSSAFRLVGLGIGLVFTLCIIILSVPLPHEQSSLDSVSFSLESL